MLAWLDDSNISSRICPAQSSGNVLAKFLSCVSVNTGSVATSRKTLKRKRIENGKNYTHLYLAQIFKDLSETKVSWQEATTYLWEYFARIVFKFLVGGAPIVALSCDANTINSSSL